MSKEVKNTLYGPMDKAFPTPRPHLLLHSWYNWSCNFHGQWPPFASQDHNHIATLIATSGNGQWTPMISDGHYCHSVSGSLLSDQLEFSTNSRPVSWCLANQIQVWYLSNIPVNIDQNCKTFYYPFLENNSWRNDWRHPRETPVILSFCEEILPKIHNVCDSKNSFW